MKAERLTSSEGEEPLAALERALIKEFLQSRGHTEESVRGLPPDAAHALLREASLHASLRLTEVEARAHYTRDLHDPTHPLGDPVRHKQ